jgi:hypothetical protein
MYNVTFTLPQFVNNREQDDYVKTLKVWLTERNIKHWFTANPPWLNTPTEITMRAEDAIIFKLVFGLE